MSKFKVPAEVAVRPLQTFDPLSDCQWHRPHRAATHLVTVLVDGHAVIIVPACDECAWLMEHGTDWRGEPPKKFSRELGF